MTRRRIVARSTIATALVGAAALTAAVGPSFGDSDPGSFDPTVTFETSTTRATAHPDARITIDNTGNTANIGSISLSLPDGFWGSVAAVPTKCASFTGPDADPINFPQGDDTCTADSKIGTVTTEATIDKSDTKISGDVFIVNSPSLDDVAEIGIKVHARVGGVDLGYVRVVGHALVRGNAVGIDTVVENIPSSITDAHNRTVSFHLNKMVMDLVSNLDGTLPPLLTNPSRCGTTHLTGTIGTGPTLGSSIDSAPIDVPYTVDGCDTTTFGPTAFNFTNTITTADTPTGFSTQIDLPADSASLQSVSVQLPSMLGPNFSAFGTTADQCPANSADFAGNFDTTSCPESAKFGTVTLNTPLLPDSLTGTVYLINKSPLPWLGIDINPNIPGNPPGVSLHLVGQTDTPQRDASCVEPLPDLRCQRAIRADFRHIPDAPATSITLSLDSPDRSNNANNATLSSKMLTIAQASECQPSDEVEASFSSNSTVADLSATPKQSWRVSSAHATGCNTDPVDITSGPVGVTTNDTTPTFAVAPLGAPGPNFKCGVDKFSATFPGVTCNSTTSFTSATLGYGAHRFYAGTTTTATGDHTTRAFAVEPDPTTPGPAPDTSFSTTPPATTGTTPSFSFASTQTSSFQCSIDAGAFLPCDPSAAPSPTGTFAVQAADAFFPGSSPTFAVRAQNAEGTVDINPASASFHVTVPFAPTFDAQLSTNVARSHPDLDVTITNPSEEKLKDMTIKLPDGFFGGLQGVQSICPVAIADAGNCTSASQVGTIETEGVVDDSVIRVDGTVYLTEARQAGDPAGLSIKVPAVLQDVDLGNIIVPARLAVRGQAQGIDSLVIDSPDRIVPPVGSPDSTTFFNLRKIVLKLRTGSGAAQPLLTNPSSCDSLNFDAEFTGYGSSTRSVLQPFSVAGCEALPFTPSLSASIVRQSDGKAPNATPYQPISLTATLQANPDDAGIKTASVLMPKPLTISVAKLGPACEEAQYLTNTCPAVTKIGAASATSPLLLPGESLSGPVYLLRGDHTALPRVFVRLEGRISLSLVGTTSFENSTQIRTVFADLPDAPLNSFTLTVDSLLSTTKSPCQDAVTFGGSMTGSLTGHNGKSAGVQSAFTFDCSGTYVSQVFKKKGKRSTLRLKLDNRGSQPKAKKLSLKFVKRLTLNRRGIKKKLVIIADGKKLKSKCFKAKSAAVLEISFCGKKAKLIDLNFKAGSLTAAKKLRSPKVTITSIGTDNKKLILPLSLKKPATKFSLPFIAK